MIAWSIYAQVDLEGNDTSMMDCMVEYKLNEHALTIQYQKIVVKGIPSLLRSTVERCIFIQWEDLLTSWEKLSDMK